MAVFFKLSQSGTAWLSYVRTPAGAIKWQNLFFLFEKEVVGNLETEREIGRFGGLRTLKTVREIDLL